MTDKVVISVNEKRLEEMNIDEIPILLLAYNRPNHYSKTIESLSLCDGARDSILYVHIDGANVYKDETNACKEIVDITRKYISRFTRIEIMAENYHCGLANSVICSVSKLISEYGKIIVVEDDLLLSKDFVIFMKEALMNYENDKSIWSVTGRSIPLLSLKNYSHDVFITGRGCSHGWGTWKDRWNSTDWTLNDYNKFENDYLSQLNFAKGGFDLPGMLRAQKLGLIDSWAIRWCYSEYLQHKYTVYSRLSRVYNIGDDDSATHTKCKIIQEPLTQKSTTYSFRYKYSSSIIRDFRHYYQTTYSEWLNNIYKSRNGYRDKNEALMNVFEKLLSIKENNHSINDYFLNRNYRRIIVYGFGKVGKHIINELSLENFFVRLIDKNKKVKSSYLINDEEDFFVNNKVDIIVVTIPLEFDEICGHLRKYFDGRIVSIVDIVNDR